MRRLISRFVGSVRVRITVTALLAVGCAMVVAAGVIQLDLHHERQKILLNSAEQDAREVVAFNPTLSSPVFVPSGATIDSGFLQVIVGGRVVGASKPLRHLPPLWQPGAPRVQPVPDFFADTARDAVMVSVPVQAGKAVGDVVVISSMAQFDHTVADIQRLLEIGTPMLLGVVGVICWVVVGRSLSPIERMRRQVAGMSVSTRDGYSYRVAEPANEDEIARLARTLNSMLDRLEASSRRERRFVSDASHELRSPIANIRTELEVAMHHPAVTDWIEVAGEVLEQNRRMEELVSGLLLLARSDEGSLIASKEPTDLAALVERIVADAAPTGPTVVLEASPVLVGVPPVYAERMVANLVDNGRRFAESALTVKVGPVVEDGLAYAQVTVSDDGPGVAEADRERIFERFVRLDSARDRGEGGFGLGLAIVADLSRFYGGTIRAGGVVGEGAEFVLRLPAIAAATPSLTAPAPHPHPHPHPAPVG